MASDGVEVVVLGVDASDPRAAAELSRWIPAETTAIYRTPALDEPRTTGLDGWQYPPERLLALARGSRGRSADGDAIASTIDAVAADRDLSVHELSTATPAGSAERSEWWTAGAWTVTGIPVVIAIAAVALIVAEDTLLRWAFSVLITIAAFALLVGFHYAHAAAAIHRADPEIAGAAARAIADDADGPATGADAGSARAERPVLIVPERNAAGVAAELRDLGVDARARILAADGDPTDASATDPNSWS